MSEDPLWQLAVGFAGISMIAIGGGIAVVPEMNRLVVDVHGWMTDARFAQLFALAQAAPGPNVLVVGLIGWHVAGLAGMLAAVLAMCGPAGLLAYGFARLRTRLAGAAWLRVVERGLVPVAVGLIFSSGIILAQAAAVRWLAVVVSVGSTLFVWRTEASPLWVLGVGAVLGALFL
ncbi:chromate transporter [Falsiroseomonas selenitidurans]|uniref:Chromate transporter n=1 Tax=Falsiroseomonas selenitidurans TaxID=2716335 RepID=A0ABX1E3N0_9PROT|nr:chromate transporter [Falsiroseomonas selenitidurans]NKC31786.1 chromate transporter [Falsiroseomonas selenitidurans]